MKNAVSDTILQRLELFFFFYHSAMTTNCLQIKHDIRVTQGTCTCKVEVSIYFLLISVLSVTMDQNDKILDMSLGVVFCPIFFFHPSLNLLIKIELSFFHLPKG